MGDVVISHSEIVDNEAVIGGGGVVIGTGSLTVTQASMITGFSFEEAEDLLREMVASGYVDVGNEPESGVIVYYFPELQARRRLGPDKV